MVKTKIKGAARALVKKGAQEGANKTTAPTFNAPAGAPGQSLTLMKLPLEVKVKIFNMCVISEGPIRPVQLVGKSNKFLWSSDQITGSPGVKNVGGAEPLTAVALTMVCKELYELVALGHLFYKHNHFAFMDPDEIIKYLVAITEPRRMAIHSMSIPCNWRIGRRSQMPHVFTLVGSCAELKSLDIELDTLFVYFLNHDLVKMQTYPAIDSMKTAVQGLENLHVTHPRRTPDYFRSMTAAQKETMIAQMIANVASPLADSLKLVRTGQVNATHFRKAQEYADLDVHGGGRISNDDKKPGIVASRTRAQLKLLQHIDDDGVVPKRVSPKYDGDGMLAWRINEISRSRVVASDGEKSVEFEVKCQPSKDSPVVVFWESAEKMLDDHSRQEVLNFCKYYHAEGMETIVGLWKSTGVDDEDDFKELANYIGKYAAKVAEDAALKKKVEEKAKGKAKIKAAKAVEAKAARATKAKAAKNVKAAKKGGKVAK